MKPETNAGKPRKAIQGSTLSTRFSSNSHLAVYYENSMVETFFKTIKSEVIWPVAGQSRYQTENAVTRYIDGLS